MLNFIIGFALGYWVAFNKETIITYWNKLKEYIISKKNKNNTNENNTASN